MDSILQQITDWLKEMLVAGIMDNLTDTFAMHQVLVGNRKDNFVLRTHFAVWRHDIQELSLAIQPVFAGIIQFFEKIAGTKAAFFPTPRPTHYAVLHVAGKA